MKKILTAAAILLSATAAFAGERLGPPAGNWNPGDTQGAEQGGPRGVSRGGENRDGGVREHGAFADLLHVQQQDIEDRDRTITNPAGHEVQENLGLFGVFICGEDGAGACGR